jgi:hypothetical protein
MALILGDSRVLGWGAGWSGVFATRLLSSMADICAARTPGMAQQ